MNKNFFTSAMAVAALAVSFTSCDKSNQQQEAAAPAQTAPVELKIGYVEVDSIMSQYQFCKDYTLILEKKSQNRLTIPLFVFSSVSGQSSRARQRSSTRLSATLSSTSSLYITRTRSILSFSQSRVTTSSMVIRLLTSLLR